MAREASGSAQASSRGWGHSCQITSSESLTTTALLPSAVMLVAAVPRGCSLRFWGTFAKLVLSAENVVSFSWSFSVCVRFIGIVYNPVIFTEPV